MLLVEFFGIWKIMQSLPVVFLKQIQPVPQAPGIAAVARGPAAPQPMAPRGNAAVETTKPKQDPFADLFS